MGNNVNIRWDVANIYGEFNRQVHITPGHLKERPIELAIRSEQTTIQAVLCALTPEQAIEIGRALIQMAERGWIPAQGPE